MTSVFVSPILLSVYAGVFEDLIRVSVGIEDIDDLKEDFAQAFANIAD